MRVAVVTPLPPARTGVAHYASMLLPALGQHVDLVPIESADQVIYQLGNNPFHESAYLEAMRRPGVIVLHDLVLHHLIVEMTIARGDVEGYVAALEANHGPAGAAWARGRAIGLHTELANFLMPASIEVARRSRAVIVHNQYARDRLRSFGVTTPIHVVPHPYVRETRTFDRFALRAQMGIGAQQRVIGFFGFLTSAKRAEIVLEAFRIAREREPGLVLLVVGEPAPDIDVAALQGSGIVMTGYVADDEFPSYYAVADRLVNLRYPSAGETSGTLIRAFDAGKPVAVSDYAQFAELPDDCAFKVPLGEGEIERLVAFFVDELEDPSAAQRAWLQKNATLDATVAGYLAALGETPHPPSAPSPRARGEGVSTSEPSLAAAGEGGPERSEGPGEGLSLFPQLSLIDAKPGSIALRNDGITTIRARTYGEPEYRVIARVFDGPREVFAQWLALPGDLAPGGVAEIRFREVEGTLRLYHALQDVPMLEDEPFATAEVRRV